MRKYLGIVLIFLFSVGKAATYGPYSPSTITNLALAGSSTVWNNLNNATTLNSVESNINSLSANGDYSDYLLATNFNAAIPSGATITGIFVEVNRRTELPMRQKQRIKRFTCTRTDSPAPINPPILHGQVLPLMIVMAVQQI
ncbi:MAG: hypothetical protein ACO3EE_11475 [Flavobacteriales bacterium]